jgi:hypothetical protein
MEQSTVGLSDALKIPWLLFCADYILSISQHKKKVSEGRHHGKNKYIAKANIFLAWEYGQVANLDSASSYLNLILSNHFTPVYIYNQLNRDVI